MAGLVRSLLFFAITAALGEFACAQQVDTSDKTNAEVIFGDRIMPIFRSPNPSSCVQCHLSSVDLKDYILPSSDKTFVSLRDQGLIDLDNPPQSKILTLISMGDRDGDEKANMIHKKMRDAEFDAFSKWIESCCADQRLRDLPSLDKSELAKPSSADEVIRHARKSRIVNSFVRNVWSQRMRCFPCHTPHEIGPNQKAAKEKFELWNDQFGDKMLIFKETPEQTMDYLIQQSVDTDTNEMPLLNLEHSEKSLLVLKPTSKIPPQVDGKRSPTYTEPIYHGGGLKMHKDDHSYKLFIAWINDYANITHGNYKSVADLPGDNWFPTNRVLRIADISKDWVVGTPVQVFLYPKIESETGVSDQPIAFMQGTITPRYFVNGPLILLAPTDPVEFNNWKSSNSRLPAGTYVAKVFVDTNDVIKDNPTALLDHASYAGKLEFRFEKWENGFPNAQVISSEKMR